MKNNRSKGLFSWYGFNTPIVERLKKIKDSGFDSTMLWWGDKNIIEENFLNDAFKSIKYIEMKIEND